jgi:acetyltransferase
MQFRFFQVFSEVSHETLTRYCNLDYDREIAIVAEIQKDRKKIIGVVLLLLEPGGKRGEFAVLVGDQWQGLGLGSKLIDYIIEIGRDMGLNIIYGYTMSSNTKMVHLCTEKGFKMEPFEGEIAKITLELS